MDLQYGPDPFAINIEIWLPRFFPAHAPMVYVVPTGSQQLRPSNVVDPTGRVQHSYIAYWHTRPGSSLIEMMNYLHQAFCQEPPIYLDRRASSVDIQSIPQPSGTSVAQMKATLKERLYHRHNKLQHHLSEETDRILAENSLLQDGAAKLITGLTALRNEIKLVQDEIEQTKARNASLMDQLDHLKAAGEVDIDNLVIPQGQVGKQYYFHSHFTKINNHFYRLLRELATDLTIQDCIYEVGKVFERGQIDLASYLKSTRELAKEQFFSKATVIKILETHPELK